MYRACADRRINYKTVNTNQSKLTQLCSWDIAGVLLADDGTAAALTTQHNHQQRMNNTAAHM